MNDPTSSVKKPQTSARKKKDTTILLAIIGGLVTLCTTCISVILAPAFLTWFDKTVIQTQAKATTTPELTISTNSQQSFYYRGRLGGYVVVLPSCNCSVALRTGDNLLIRLRWGAETSELAEQGANLVTYTVAIDGKPVSDIGAYRKPAEFVEKPLTTADPPNTWWVYWDYPVNKSPRVIDVTLETLAAIDTGQGIIPAGTKDTFSVHFPHFIPGRELPP